MPRSSSISGRWPGCRRWRRNCGGELGTLTRGNEIFLRMMTANALAAAPPLGRLRDFVTVPESGGTVDLKKFGSRIFVDAARILALGHAAPPKPAPWRACAVPPGMG
jgi:signal-transduction protein with cAMP-binding, CBS, and nucleotidyltransferase domain